MSDDTLAHCLLLERCGALSRRDAVNLLQCGPDTGACLAAGAGIWQEAGLSEASCAAFAAHLRSGWSRETRSLHARMTALGVGAIAICDADYPALLRMIDSAPPWLYVRGDRSLLSRPQLAVVGSRKPSPQGLRAAGQLAGQLTVTDLVITSGLALGIDGAAHRGALAAGGATIAVMATGIDIVYPRRHEKLAEDIMASGCLVSELSPGATPRRSQFPRRNRIISGMSLGTLVVEAALPSGSLLTASAAAAQGREVFALPWSVYHPGGRGCLQLLRDGAALVESAADITDNLGWYSRAAASPCPADEAPPEHLSASARRVLRSLDSAQTDPDTLANLSGESLESVLVSLAELEVNGLAVRGVSGYALAQ